MTKLDEVVARYGDASVPTDIIIGHIDDQGALYVAIEAPPEGLRFLAEVFMAMADEEEESCSWDIHPRAAGSAWFDTRSPRGLVFHRLPCDEGLLSEELRGESSRHG